MKESGFRRTQALFLLLTALCVAGCGFIPPRPQISPDIAESAHAVAMPSLPASSFDQRREQAELTDSQAARQRGDLTHAGDQALAATTDWPGDAAAWAELATIRTAQGDDAGARDADFFHDQVELTATMPPRVAALGYADLASTPPSAGHDQALLDSARRLAAFYNLIDRQGFSRH